MIIEAARKKLQSAPVNEVCIKTARKITCAEQQRTRIPRKALPHLLVLLPSPKARGVPQVLQVIPTDHFKKNLDPVAYHQVEARYHHRVLVPTVKL